jgi:hypothetical protein
MVTSYTVLSAAGWQVDTHFFHRSWPNAVAAKREATKGTETQVFSKNMDAKSPFSLMGGSLLFTLRISLHPQEGQRRFRLPCDLGFGLNIRLQLKQSSRLRRPMHSSTSITLTNRTRSAFSAIALSGLVLSSCAPRIPRLRFPDTDIQILPNHLFRAFPGVPVRAQSLQTAP